MKKQVGGLLLRLCRYLSHLAELPRPVRRIIIGSFDLSLCAGAVWLSFWLRLGDWDWFTPPILTFLGLALASWIFSALLFGVHRHVVRFSGRHTVLRLMPSFAMMSAILACVLFTIHIPGIPRTLAVIHPMVFFFALSAGRLGAAMVMTEALHLRHYHPAPRKVLIYGAGSAGRQLAIALRQEAGVQLVGFIDGNRAHRGRILEGKRIWHDSDLDTVLVRHDVSEVYIAIPSASRTVRRELVDRLRKSAGHPQIRSLPTMSQIASGRVTFSDLREVQIEELLGRDEVAPVPELMEKTITGKVVMVTGAGGSIGSELCRQILKCAPSELILVERNEPALYGIEQELLELCAREKTTVDVTPKLVDVSLEKECAHLFEKTRSDTVFHAAAYKHVPMVEANPIAGVRNNIFGALFTARNAREAGAGHFILVSTDKAVRPTNVMGASKRVCELVVQALAAEGSSTVFSAVRFGNVLGSSGSVVPKFRAQIARGGPVTLTHREVTRYFMTIPEAAQLVIQAGAMATGGEVFLLDMGEPVKVAQLARTMIELAGLSVKDEVNPAGDIEIMETGLRPGEKLYEELLIGDNPQSTAHPRIVLGREDMLNWRELTLSLDRIADLISFGREDEVVSIVSLLVPGFTSKRWCANLVVPQEELERLPETKKKFA